MNFGSDYSKSSDVIARDRFSGPISSRVHATGAPTVLSSAAKIRRLVLRDYRWENDRARREERFLIRAVWPCLEKRQDNIIDRLTCQPISNFQSSSRKLFIDQLVTVLCFFPPPLLFLGFQGFHELRYFHRTISIFSPSAPRRTC